MFMAKAHRLFPGVRGVVAVAGLAGLALPAAGQQQEVRVFSATAGAPMGGRGGGQISQAALDRYGELLSLDDSQKELAGALYEGYATAYQEASKTRNDAMQAVRQSFQESQDPEVFREKMPEITRVFAEKSAALEKQFFADLRSVLTPQQEQGFAKVERLRRRETGLRGPAGAGVDLTDVARALSLSGPEVAESLDQYEVQVDRVLVDREQTLRPPSGGFETRFDPEQMEEMMARSREYSESLREINETFSRRLEALVPEGRRDEFRQEIRRRTYPQVYRESYVARSLSAAERFADLSSDQRQALADLRAVYDRDLPSANDSWADAIAVSEKDSNSGAFATPDGGTMQLRFGEEPEALREARKARRDLDDRTREKLDSILTKEQKERLPKREENDGPPGLMGQSIMIQQEVR